MVLHFVSFDFVVWWTSYCWKTSAVNLKKKLRHRTAVFFTSMDPTSYVVFFVTSLPWMHGLQTDCMIWFFFGTSNRMPIFLANLVDLYFTVLLGTPDALIGKLHFCYRFFYSGMISNFLKFWALHFNTCGAHLVNNFSWKGPVSLRTINFKLSVWRSSIVTSVWGEIQRRTSKRNFNLRGPRFWLRTSPSRTFGISTSSNIVKNFWLLLKALVTWLKRPTEGWTPGWTIRCFQLRVWTIHFYFLMWRKLMETYWRISHSRSTLVRQWLELWKVMK